MKAEFDQAITQGTADIEKQGLVLAINRNGKVIKRGVGMPPWKNLVEEILASLKK